MSVDSDSFQTAFPPVRASHVSSEDAASAAVGNGSTSHEYTSLANTQVLSAAKVLDGQLRSLSGVSLRAFLLGISLGVSSLAAGLLIFHHQMLWRAPFFVAALSLFHFLEYYMTATFNTQYAFISAFLLSQNGKAYNIAHTTAFAECLIRILQFPTWQINHPFFTVIGLLAIIIGQITRSTAMAHAGTNFNHTVQTQKNRGHEIVTSGIYRLLRHPSYFGFFWWALGTQLVLGNPLSFLAYTVVLWSFFRKRIAKEEEFLIIFFGKDYQDYRDRTPVLIPFIP